MFSTLIVVPCTRRMARLMFGFLALVWLAGCSPKFDWRDVRQEEAGWLASFPGKTVEVSRGLNLPGAAAPVTLTLRATRIDETLFAVGWVMNGSEPVRKSLEAAMIANINAVPSTVIHRRVTLSGREGIAATEVRATGEVRAEPPPSNKPGVVTKLWMRTVTIGGSSPRVIEIIAVGPANSLTEEVAEQFLESLRITN